MYRKRFLCDNCGADFVISHELYDEVEFCPFCGENIYDDDDYEEDDEE